MSTLPSETIQKKMLRDIDFDSLFGLDSGIRFVGVCNTHGQLLDVKYRDGVEPLFDDYLLQSSAMRTVIRHSLRMDESAILGIPEYSITSYEKVKRITILADENLLLLVSVEKESNAEDVTMMILKHLS